VVEKIGTDQVVVGDDGGGLGQAALDPRLRTVATSHGSKVTGYMCCFVCITW
jgi:hypothetical protein